MRKLKVIVSQWPTQQRDYYDNVISSLVKNSYITDNDLLEEDFNTLCATTGIGRQILRAFIQHVINETLPKETIRVSLDKAHLPTGFEQLDKVLLGGFEKGKVFEICSLTHSICSRFTLHVMASFILSHSNQEAEVEEGQKGEIAGEVHLFDTTGIFEPKHLQQLLSKQNVEMNVLSAVNYTQLFTLSELSSSLEHLCASLITASNNNNNTTKMPLVIIKDISKIVGSSWNQRPVLDFISHIQNICKLGCFVLIEHTVQVADMTEKPSMKKYEMYWNPSIDTRLYLTNINDSKQTRVDLLKARHVVAPQSHSIQID